VRGALETGARFGELAAARVRDYQNGKLFIAHPKTGHPRNVTLSDNGIAFFESITIGRPRDDRIFLRAGRPWQRSEQARPMKLARAAARISASITFHGLRHTWASLAVANGMPLMVIARNLGHRDTRMVEKHYGHLREDFIDKAIREHAPEYGLELEPTKVAPLRRQR
jgi:integrase